MNIKKIAGALIFSCAIVVPICINHNMRNEFDKLELKFNEAQQSILELQETEKNKDKVLDEKQKEIDKLNEAIKQKNIEYNDLNSKYQKELEPVCYNENNLLEPSRASVRKLSLALKHTALHGLEEYYIEAEKLYGVNAIFLASLTAQESAWGTSNRARNQNNLSGFEVYSSGSKGAYFSNKRESILTTAKLLKNAYLSKTGGCFKGYDIYSVNVNYCTTGGFYWSNSINSIAYNITSKINSKNR